MAVWIGTSGWQYRHWDGSFYPREIPKPGQLSYYAERFQVVEVNATFYKLPGPGVLATWADHRETLAEWAARVADLWDRRADVYVFFNNDWHRCALRDAGWFACAAEARGLRTTRVADPETIAVG